MFFFCLKVNKYSSCYVAIIHIFSDGVDKKICCFYSAGNQIGSLKVDYAPPAIASVGCVNFAPVFWNISGELLLDGNCQDSVFRSETRWQVVHSR